MHRFNYTFLRRARVALVAAVLIAVSIVSACSPQPRYPAPSVNRGDVVFDTASLPFEIPQFFTVVHEGRNISFFIIRLKTGVLSFFDACVTCFPQKRGYAAKDGRVVCRACSTEYSIYKLDKGIGGCYPIQIHGFTEGGTYRIPLAMIRSEARKF